jgi:phosphoribosylformylglycinamidine (FGAM) synthase PurS component
VDERIGVIAMLNPVKSCLSAVGFSLVVWSMTTGAAVSQGQTITLRVPVEVEKMYKNVQGMEVRCSILDATGRAIKTSGHLEDVKGLVNGALSDVYEIVIELSDEEALAAKRYKCDLLVGWGYGLEPAMSSSTGGPDPDEQFPQRLARPDEFFRKSVSGDLVPVDSLPPVAN